MIQLNTMFLSGLPVADFLLEPLTYGGPQVIDPDNGVG